MVHIFRWKQLVFCWIKSLMLFLSGDFCYRWMVCSRRQPAQGTTVIHHLGFRTTWQCFTSAADQISHYCQEEMSLGAHDLYDYFILKEKSTAFPRFFLSDSNHLVCPTLNTLWLPVCGSQLRGDKCEIFPALFCSVNILSCVFTQREPPQFIASAFTEFGKWMDGWETRRKRIPGLYLTAEWSLHSHLISLNLTENWTWKN